MDENKLTKLYEDDEHDEVIVDEEYERVIFSRIEKIPFEYRSLGDYEDAHWTMLFLKTNDAKVRSDICIRINNCFPKKVLDQIQEIKDVFALVGIIISDLDTGISDSRLYEQMVEFFIMRRREPEVVSLIEAHHVIYFGFLPEVAESIAAKANAITSKSSVREKIAFVACRELDRKLDDYMIKKYGP